MTPEEEALLNQYLLMQAAQTNPVAFQVNQWGQGPDVLFNNPKKPASWSRAGDIDQILTDALDMAGLDFGETIPGLYDYVAAPKPEDLMVAPDPMVSLYENDPIMQRIRAATTGPNAISITQAVNALKKEYETDPSQFVDSGLLPMTDPRSASVGGINMGGDPTVDWNALTNTYTDWATKSNEYGNEQAQADLLAARYDDYVRNRTAWDRAGAPTMEEAIGKAPQREMPSYADAMSRAKKLAGPGPGPGQSTEDYYNRLSQYAGRMLNSDRKKADEEWEKDPKRLKRRAQEAGYRTAKRRGESVNVGSKKEENMAKLIAAYNSAIYGQA